MNTKSDHGFPLYKALCVVAVCVSMIGVFNYQWNASSKLPSTSDHESPSDNATGFVAHIKDCKTLACIQQAHNKLPRKKDQFNFPHAMIVGWQKAATTAIFSSLRLNVGMMYSLVRKEPEFFTADCKTNAPHNCSLDDQERYIWDTLRLEEYVYQKGRRVAIDSSTHYAMLGYLVAPAIREAFPWIKIIISLREPISRAISMLVHLRDVQDYGCLTEANATVYHCLVTDSQLTGRTWEFNFIDSPYGNYSYPLKHWMANFPPEQMYVVQHEALAGDHQKHILGRMKEFLGLNPLLPPYILRKENIRKTYHPEGWPMKKEEYLKLIEWVQEDVNEVAKLVEDNRYGAPGEWKRYWEEVWEWNLARCDDNDDCMIQLS